MGVSRFFVSQNPAGISGFSTWRMNDQESVQPPDKLRTGGVILSGAEGASFSVEATERVWVKMRESETWAYLGL